MSSVVGIIQNKKVWIGGDSRASTCDGSIRPIIAKKVFRNGPYLIGFIGSIRGGQIIDPLYFKPPKDIYLWPDDLRRHSEEKGCLGATEDNCNATLCNYLIGYKGKLFEILEDFQLNEVENFSAIGSGSPFAYGSLHTTQELKYDPPTRIRIALEAASFFDAATAPPFLIEKL